MSTQVIDTEWGKLAVYKKDDCISATYRGGQFWDGPLLLPFYEKYAKADALAIDIGSFNGAGALYLSKLCRHVIAVEPVHYALVQETFAANALKNVTMLPGAAYDKPGWLTFVEDEGQGQKVAGVPLGEIDNPGGVALRRATIAEADEFPCFQAVVLDKWIDEDEDVCLVKVDAQGCDLRALVGMKETLERCKPAVLFEYEEGPAKLQGDTWGAYERFFSALGYGVEEQTEIGYPRNFVAVPR